MNPGKELDAEVASKVMGWVNETKFVHNWTRPSDIPGPTRNDLSDIPNYSTDLNDAWKVVEKIYTLQRGLTFQIHDRGHGFIVQFHDYTCEEQYWVDNGESIPHKICLAAIRVILKDYEPRTDW